MSVLAPARLVMLPSSSSGRLESGRKRQVYVRAAENLDMVSSPQFRLSAEDRYGAREPGRMEGGDHYHMIVMCGVHDQRQGM